MCRFHGDATGKTRMLCRRKWFPTLTFELSCCRRTTAPRIMNIPEMFPLNQQADESPAPMKLVALPVVARDHHAGLFRSALTRSLDVSALTSELGVTRQTALSE